MRRPRSRWKWPSSTRSLAPRTLRLRLSTTTSLSLSLSLALSLSLTPAPEQVADASDAKVDELEAQRASLFNSLPNLLDPRTPEGDDEDSNVEVSQRAGRHRLLTSPPGSCA